MSTPVLHSTLVRILKNDHFLRLPVGAGFLVTPRHILTCAHVVNAGLKLSIKQAEQPTTPVWLDFPLLLPHSPHAPLNAKVKVWHPMCSPQQPGEVEDIAVLELEGAVLPPDARPAPLVEAERFHGRPVRMFGFPRQEDDGDWLDGKLQGPLGNGWVQIDTGRDSRPVRPGFSGGPVWDSRENAVAGMMVAADVAKGIYTGEDILSAYMMPTKTLIKACPGLSLAVRECLEPAPDPFLHLRERFADTPYFPTSEDLQQGRFYFHAGYHQQLEQHLAEQRRALIVGRSGSGKTALAYSLGFRFVQEDSVHRVFYTDTAPRTPGAWLEAMRTHDFLEYLFVIDDVHDFPDACNELLDSFGAVRYAHLLLVSQPLPKSLAGPEDESYLGRLRPHSVELQLDTEQLAGVLDVFAQRGQVTEPDIGDKQKLLYKC